MISTVSKISDRSSFRKAERKQAKLRAAICGPAGSGKTYSALLLASELGSRIAVIDTEHGSAELYSDMLEYDVAQITPPYTPQKYIQLIREASREYDVLVIDSLSHAWAGEGGVLEMHTDATKAQRTQNSYTAWRDVTPKHNELVNAILNAPCHVIVTMRSKTAYEQIDEGGKKKVVKLGLAPVQREGIEYEFTLCLDVNYEHYAVASKDRTRLWDGRGERITAEHGRELKNWLESGRPIPVAVEPPLAEPEPPIGSGSPSHRALEARITELGLNRDGIKTWMNRRFHVEHFPDLTASQQHQIIEALPMLAVAKLRKQIGTLTDPAELTNLGKNPPIWLQGDDLAAVLLEIDERLSAIAVQENQ